MNPSPSEETLASKINFQAIHFEPTAAMENVVREKFAVLLRHSDEIVRVNIRLQQDQKIGTEHHYTATAQIEIGGPDIVASVDGKEAYELLDGLVDKLDRQLRRRHGRRKDKRNHPQDTEIDAALPKVE